MTIKLIQPSICAETNRNMAPRRGHHTQSGEMDDTALTEELLLDRPPPKKSWHNFVLIMGGGGLARKFDLKM